MTGIVEQLSGIKANPYPHLYQSIADKTKACDFQSLGESIEVRGQKFAAARKARHESDGLTR